MFMKTPEPELQEGDILVRPKRNGIGYHFGTVVRTEAVFPPNALLGFYPKFLAAHTMPETGKHPDTIAGFFDGMPGMRIRPQRSVAERQVIEQRAVSDFGRQYGALENCETDVNRVQTGTGTSPTANLIGGGIAVGLFLWFFGLD